MKFVLSFILGSISAVRITKSPFDGMAIQTAMDLRLNKWGEVDPSLSPESIYDDMATESNVRDYILDGPGGNYRDSVAPPS